MEDTLTRLKTYINKDNCNLILQKALDNSYVIDEDKINTFLDNCLKTPLRRKCMLLEG